MLAAKKLFQDATIRTTTDKQTNNWPAILFDIEYFPFEKIGPGQIRTLELCPHRHIQYLLAKLTGNAWK